MEWSHPQSDGNDSVSFRYSGSAATLALPLLSLPLRWDKKWQSIWAYAVLLSLPVIISFLVLDRLGEMQLGGLDQRIFLSVTLMWMWILGSKMLAIESQRQR